MSEVTVTIFNHNYRLAVSTGEEELLKNCAKLVDDQMSAVRAGGKVIAVDQIAVLSALEIAYDAQKKEEEAASRLAEVELQAQEQAAAAQKALEEETAKVETAQAALAAATAAQPVPLQTEAIPAAPVSASAEATSVNDNAALAEIQALCRLCEEALYKDATLGLRI